MVTLTAHEARVLGTLIEKAQTVPGSYPMTLNGLTTGCNQKNNRLPITELSDDEVFDAIETLRRKNCAREVMLSGSRVQKFRHVAREALNVSTEELVLVAELLLRGPQSLGDLRIHASRMVPSGLDSLETTQKLLEGLMTRDPPMVKQVPPPPGSRAALYVQLISPDLHAIPDGSGSMGSASASTSSAATSDLEPRVRALEAQIVELRRVISALATSVGEQVDFQEQTQVPRS